MGNDLRVGGGYQVNSYDPSTIRNNQPNQATDDLPSIDVILQDQSELNTTGVKGRVPSSGISFGQEPTQAQQNLPQSDDLPTLEDLAIPENIVPTNNVESNPVYVENTNSSSDDLPPLGQVEAQAELPQENDYKPKSSKDHSYGKMLVHLESYGGQKVITNVATGFIRKATEKAVEQELTQVIATIGTKKIAAKVGTTVGEKITAGATEGALKTVTALTGKGVMPIGVREAARQSGNLVKALEESAYASSEILLKGGIKSLPKNAGSALIKTGIGSGEKALSIGMKEGTAKAVETVLTKAGSEVTGKVAAKTLEKQTVAAVEKATAEVAVKGGTKFAVRAAKAMPYVHAAVGAGITIWDAKDAMEKTRDSKASTTSKVLAWGTVGLDVVSTVTAATGKGKPIGWAATVLGIGTSIASDYTR
ncbi:MAG: hypothetical protein U0457_14180 [Candidatus Sericytochromatia bacterium]